MDSLTSDVASLVQPGTPSIVMALLKMWGAWALLTIGLGYLYWLERKEHGRTKKELQKSYDVRLEDAKSHLDDSKIFMEVARGSIEANVARRETDSRLVSVQERLLERINLLLDRPDRSGSRR